MKLSLTLLWSALTVQALPSSEIHSDTDKLSVNWKHLTKEISLIRKDWRVPGLAVGVVHKGQLVFSKGFGSRNVNDNKEPVNTDTLFQIASCSKAFTSFAIGMMVDDNKLDWNSKATSQYPVSFQDPVAHAHASLFDMLTHRTGLPANDFTLALYNNSEDLLTKVQYMVPRHEFREKFLYVNHMYALAGTIAGQASGLGSWDKLIQHKIFEPLGMNNSLTDLVEALPKKNRASGHYYDDNGEVQSFNDEEAWWSSPIKPAGTIVSSINDLAKWVALITRQGVLANGTSLISKSQFKKLTSPQIILPDTSPVSTEPIQLQSYGIGWIVDSYRGKVRVQHSGNHPGFHAVIDTYANEDLAIISLSNVGATKADFAVAQTIADRIFFPRNKEFNRNKYYLDKHNSDTILQQAAITEYIASRKPNAPPTLPLASYQGTFNNVVLGNFTLKLNGTDSHFYKFEWTANSKITGVIGHWQDNEFGIFHLDSILFKYSNYSVPTLSTIFAVDGNSFDLEIEEGVNNKFSRVRK
ncbi:UNVERIFIED_CONTAM: hypothetical protein HDU68_001417 [Siphonaria sp. JEL0065]|nr:hypothetical protein HDU68_001417 [Siphonaria sp. JEL0065]